MVIESMQTKSRRKTQAVQKLKQESILSFLFEITQLPHVTLSAKTELLYRKAKSEVDNRCNGIQSIEIETISFCYYGFAQ